MIFYIITEIREKYEKVIYGNVKMILENISGDICLMLHWPDLTRELIEKHQPWALVHSGRGSDYNADPVLDAETYKDIILNSPVPQLGICGGHQIIAHYYGSALGELRRLRDDEPDNYPDYNPGYFKEKGMYPIDVAADDPLFDELGSSFRVTESHFWEVKELGPGLEVIASNGNTRVQAFRDPSRCVYGVQFHPERHSDEYPDGKQLLKNFFQIART